MFRSKQKKPDASSDFAYLGENDIYVDSACQSLRPLAVIQAMKSYYTEFNSCGERVLYSWGKQVDEHIDGARENTLKLLGLSKRHYFVSFTLNTTYGLNLILSQLKMNLFSRIITSDTEHNSIFLPTMEFAKKHDVERLVVNRSIDGSVDLSGFDLSSSVVVLSSANNFDGRRLENIRDIVRDVHKAGGIVIIDAAQTMAHNLDVIRGIEADAYCFSGHKMYGPSLGVMVVRCDLLDKINPNIIGGGMVDSVQESSYVLSAHDKEHAHTIFEAGLQSYAEIIGYGAAVKWLEQNQTNDRSADLASQCYEFLASLDNVHVLGCPGSAIVSFYHDKLMAHDLARALSDQGIMARSGYFCAHYYLKEKMNYPHLLRLSFSAHNKQSDVDKIIKILGGGL